MSDCDQLLAAIVEAKVARNEAMRENARDEDAGQLPRHSTADLDALRLAVDVATLEARDAGCDVDDLVGPNVGNLDEP